MFVIQSKAKVILLVATFAQISWPAGTAQAAAQLICVNGLTLGTTMEPSQERNCANSWTACRSANGVL